MYIANYEDKVNASADLADFENSNPGNNFITKQRLNYNLNNTVGH